MMSLVGTFYKNFPWGNLCEKWISSKDGPGENSMQNGISGTENIPYASVYCPIEELTPHLGTHMEVVGDFVRWWGVSNICFIGSHQLCASAHFLSNPHLYHPWLSCYPRFSCTFRKMVMWPSWGSLQIYKYKVCDQLVESDGKVMRLE